MFRGPGGTRLPPNIPVSPGQNLGSAKQPSDDSCTKTASSDHSGSHASHRSHNFNNQSDKGEGSRFRILSARTAAQMHMWVSRAECR